MTEKARDPKARKKRPAPTREHQKLLDLIAEHERVLKKYESDLARFPLDRLPACVPTVKLIPCVKGELGNVLELGRVEALSDAEATGRAENEKKRNDILAAHFPFQPAYFAQEGENPTPGQQAGLDLRNRLDTLIPRLRDHYDGKEEELQRFPLALWGSNFEPSQRAKDVVRDFRRHIELLRRTEPRRADDDSLGSLHRVLRSHISDRGLSIGAAAKEMSSSRDTLADFLAERRTPRRKTVLKMRNWKGEQSRKSKSNAL